MSAVEQVFGTGLKHRVAVYVPSTTSVDQEMDPAQHEANVRACLHIFSLLFHGATAQSALGCWISKQGNLVVEPVTEVYSFAADLSIHQVQAVFQLALALATVLAQESVTVVIDNEMFFVK